MATFCSNKLLLNELLQAICSSDAVHARWLNTLSYLENTGARKIAQAEHPTLVQEEMLKHAAEEFRHAHHLKRQIEKITQEKIENYSVEYMLGGMHTLHYLHALDIQTCRFLKQAGKRCNREIASLAYLLVTYAIELRADELYKVYDDVLREGTSKVSVKSILLEEKEHLREMQEALEKIAGGLSYAEQICHIEGRLCTQWLQAVYRGVQIGETAIKI